MKSQNSTECNTISVTSQCTADMKIIDIIMRTRLQTDTLFFSDNRIRLSYSCKTYLVSLCTLSVSPCTWIRKIPPSATRFLWHQWSQCTADMKISDVGNLLQTDTPFFSDTRIRLSYSYVTYLGYLCTLSASPCTWIRTISPNVARLLWHHGARPIRK